MKCFISSSSYLLLCLLLPCLGQKLSSGYDEQKGASADVTKRAQLSVRLRIPKNMGRITPSLQNATNNNSTNTTSPAPTPAVTSKPPSSGSPTPAGFTPSPTKKYIPPPDDNDDNTNDNNDEKKSKITTIFWTISSLAIAVFVLFYFRNAIAFFVGNAWRNTQRYGCNGCLHSFFPCFYTGLSSAGGHQPLDQIIFETDESSYTRSNLREGLM